MISIVSYGLGNINAIKNIYKRQNIDVEIAINFKQLEYADKLILPGVGSFDWAMNRLNASGMRECLDEMVLEKKVKVLGICVGMQMMAHSSEEGTAAGLSWIDAEVVSFKNIDNADGMNLPHMGWNDVNFYDTDSLFKNMHEPQFYFLHSFYLKTFQPEVILSTTFYHIDFTSSVRHSNIYGVQFHPEKSHKWGELLLKNFAEL
jgi:glutamine amidotransferase